MCLNLSAGRPAKSISPCVYGGKNARFQFAQYLTMSEPKPILEFEEELLRGELFAFAKIPDFWREGDYIADLPHLDMVLVLHEAADHVVEEEFDNGMPGGCTAFYRVYADDPSAFRIKLTRGLLDLLHAKYGKLKE